MWSIENIVKKWKILLFYNEINVKQWKLTLFHKAFCHWTPDLLTKYTKTDKCFLECIYTGNTPAPYGSQSVTREGNCSPRKESCQDQSLYRQNIIAIALQYICNLGAFHSTGNYVSTFITPFSFFTLQWRNFVIQKISPQIIFKISRQTIVMIHWLSCFK